MDLNVGVGHDVKLLLKPEASALDLAPHFFCHAFIVYKETRVGVGITFPSALAVSTFASFFFASFLMAYGTGERTRS